MLWLLADNLSFCILFLTTILITTKGEFGRIRRYGDTALLNQIEDTFLD